MDPATRTASRADAAIDLTARELALLEFLLRCPGDVVSKREILAHVWDYDFEGEVNIVEVYVRHLRNKLDRPFGWNAIQSIRGGGYRPWSRTSRTPGPSGPSPDAVGRAPRVGGSPAGWGQTSGRSL